MMPQQRIELIALALKGEIADVSPLIGVLETKAEFLKEATAALETVMNECDTDDVKPEWMARIYELITFMDNHAIYNINESFSGATIH